MKKKATLGELVLECLNHGISVSSVEIVGDGLGYNIDGFSKSGTGLLYSTDGKNWLETRYNRIDEIETFEDIAGVAYDWNLDYSNSSVFGWDDHWLKVFEELGWVDVEEIKTIDIKPKK